MHDVSVKAARFITEHAPERIVLADVADHVGYSPFHLARLFERHVGVPPGQFLAAHRFQRAKWLLLSGDERIIDVCFAVGFTSVGTFTEPVKIIDPVNAANNVSRLYTDAQADSIVEAALDAGDAIDSALGAPTKQETVYYWQKVFGSSFQV